MITICQIFSSEHHGVGDTKRRGRKGRKGTGKYQIGEETTGKGEG